MGPPTKSISYTLSSQFNPPPVGHSRDNLVRNSKALKKYSIQTGSTKPPRGVIVDGIKIYAWAAKIRSGQRGLTKARLDMLNEINFEWGERGPPEAID